MSDNFFYGSPKSTGGSIKTSTFALSRPDKQLQEGDILVVYGYNHHIKAFPLMLSFKLRPFV
ncbi:hypothetical protein [Sphingobacterium siyangense]|uniref:Uncharacterized protein n=1 Tax=Sphingobacterium siyangense TaxID=459529 RepID=A0A562MFT1_9SPHI|nr:hypothetical protein [Sphingobacterium siyangense]TWI18783.1 hypothetical protein IQ31_02911 [Sphingobacterium siyangense]